MRDRSHITPPVRTMDEQREAVVRDQRHSRRVKRAVVGVTLTILGGWALYEYFNSRSNAPRPVEYRLNDETVQRLNDRDQYLLRASRFVEDNLAYTNRGEKGPGLLAIQRFAESFGTPGRDLFNNYDTFTRGLWIGSGNDGIVFQPGTRPFSSRPIMRQVIPTDTLIREMRKLSQRLTALEGEAVYNQRLAAHPEAARIFTGLNQAFADLQESQKPLPRDGRPTIQPR